MRTRMRAAELMDRPDADADELRRSLGDLRSINGMLGTRRAAVRLVLRQIRRCGGRPVHLVDVGTGGADIPLAIARAARNARLDVRILATDLHEGTAACAAESTAAEPWIRVARADALRLPFAADSFDIAMCHTMLHHFDDVDALRVLGELGRVARCGVVITDLARSRPALLGAKLLAATVWRTHPITRHDGPISVRAAFTPSELENLARPAIPGAIQVRREPIFHLSLVSERDALPRPGPVGGGR